MNTQINQVAIVGSSFSVAPFWNNQEEKDLYFKTWAGKIKIVREEFDITPSGEKREYLLSKWSGLCEEALGRSENIHDVSVVYYSVPFGTSIWKKAFDRWAELYDTSSR